jgi:hypothetical protein
MKKIVFTTILHFLLFFAAAIAQDSIKDKHAKLTRDDKSPGGFGGRDLYMSEKLPNGEWGPAVNLGDKINTAFDEDDPFIHPDNKTIFFSSKGHNSMGGYDIFSSIKKEHEWSEPENLGTPVNTTDDDRSYVMSPDGETGYYSSSRQEGYGQQDIYVVTPGLMGERPILVLSVGRILFDSKPVEATIQITNTENGDSTGNYKSNSITGKYTVALSPGIYYKISVKVENQEPHVEYINLKSLDNYVKIEQDIPLYSEDYMKINHIDSIGNYC